MAAEEWEAKLAKMIDRTERYINSYTRKAERSTDPKKIEKYHSKITWALTLYNNSMSQIRAKQNQPERQAEAEYPISIKCGG